LSDGLEREVLAAKVDSSQLTKRFVASLYHTKETVEKTSGHPESKINQNTCAIVDRMPWVSD
jgi:hypothetical protein